MKQFVTKTMLALGVAATVLAGAINPVSAAPLASGSAAVKQAAPADDVLEVRRWRGRHFAGALLGLGALALIYEGTRRHHRHHHYHRGYYPAYGYGYGPGCINHRGYVYCR